MWNNLGILNFLEYIAFPDFYVKIHTLIMYSHHLPASKVQATCTEENRQKAKAENVVHFMLSNTAIHEQSE